MNHRIFLNRGLSDLQTHQHLMVEFLKSEVNYIKQGYY